MVTESLLNRWLIGLGVFMVLFLALGWPVMVHSPAGAFEKNLFQNKANRNEIDALVPYWTRSYQLYRQIHTVWMSGYEYVGVNVPIVIQTLEAAEAQQKRPELVVYGIPFRDMGQSSAGGFHTYHQYYDDNKRNAALIKPFVQRTGLVPRIYLEPDALGHAIQYKRDRSNDAISQELYRVRTEAMNWLIDLYQDAGAQVYLDAAHSDWFDYDNDAVKAMAKILNDSGVAKADGIVTNVSNRQTVQGPAERNEVHYLKRLLPKLNNKNLDIVMDTSRNGGPTHGRDYYLAPNGDLVDNEFESGRWVGAWARRGDDILVKPFFGKPMKVSILTGMDKFKFDGKKMILSAPPWLDPVGDVQLGTPPSEHTGVAEINRFRYIKPPDDCDGALNCPSRVDEYASSNSKHDVNAMTLKRQSQRNYTDAMFWKKIKAGKHPN